MANSKKGSEPTLAAVLQEEIDRGSGWHSHTG